VIKASGVRVGTSEIYNVVEKLPEVADSLAIGQNWAGDQRIILFVKLSPNHKFTEELKEKIKQGSDGVGDVMTLSGEKLHVADHNGMHLMIRSNDDDMGMFNVSDVFSSNGVIHVVDNVMSPKE